MACKCTVLRLSSQLMSCLQEVQLEEIKLSPGTRNQLSNLETPKGDSPLVCGARLTAEPCVCEESGGVLSSLVLTEAKPD